MYYVIHNTLCHIMNEMKFALIFAAVVACACGAAIPDGLLPQLDGRIVGGYATTIHAHPYQVSIQRSGSHFCGGVIYNENSIITAAHCLDGLKASSLTVRVGSTYWNDDGSIITVKSYINHPSYNAKTMVNDIAVLKLSSKLVFSETVKDITLASSSPKNGFDAEVSGWGTQYSGAPSIPYELNVVDVQIVDRQSCSGNKFSYGNQIKNGMICAYAAEKDACQGDSGGPLVSNRELVGVVSWGRGCADARYPGVYTDVVTYRSWIESQ